MPLTFRLAAARDYATLEPLIIDSFGPITWFKKIDERFGPPNGRDWRARWQKRLAHAFATQTTLVGEAEGGIIACAIGTYDPDTRLGFIDIIAVDQRYQRHGYGREMLRGMLDYMRVQGAQHVHLECLSDNEPGNNLYRSEGFVEVARSLRWWITLK